MNYFKISLLFIFISIYAFGQDLSNDQIYLADPTIFKDNNTYYLYGTKSDPRIDGEGFLVYTSKDLKTWEGPKGVQNGYALKKGEAYGTKGFWAPQIFKYQGKYYMAYTANENIAIATSNSPLGPFKNNMEAIKAPVKQIDPFIFFDNGKAYMYHVRLQNGNRIFVAEMNKNLNQIKPETLKECINAKEKWEDTQNVEWPVAEGPTVFKKKKLYYLIYSANDFRNPDYAVGYATSKTPIGPWKKATNNPIISKNNIGSLGTGHGDIVIDNSGQTYYVLHTHNSNNKVHPRKTGIVKLNTQNSKLHIEQDSFNWIKVMH